MISQGKYNLFVSTLVQVIFVSKYSKSVMLPGS